MTAICDFTMELRFTEVYRRAANEHIAIREAECLKAQFPAILTAILESDCLAGRYALSQYRDREGRSYWEQNKNSRQECPTRRSGRADGHA